MTEIRIEWQNIGLASPLPPAVYDLTITGTNAPNHRIWPIGWEGHIRGFIKFHKTRIEQWADCEGNEEYVQIKNCDVPIAELGLPITADMFIIAIPMCDLHHVFAEWDLTIEDFMQFVETGNEVLKVLKHFMEFGETQNEVPSASHLTPWYKLI